MSTGFDLWCFFLMEICVILRLNMFILRKNKPGGANDSRTIDSI